MNGEPLIDAISRFEKQINLPEMTYEGLVEFFCLQLIWFLRNQTIIEPLKKRWQRRYESLRSQAAVLEKAALQEVTDAFQQLKKELQPIMRLRAKIKRIDGILAGSPGDAGFSSWPLYRHVFFEIKDLLEDVLMEPNGPEICKRYAFLGMKEKPIPRVNKSSKIVQEPWITSYFFAPSVEKAGVALEAIHWDRISDAAVVWHYFLSAEWYWNTDESYFETTPNLLKRGGDPFPELGIKAAWLEIAQIKNHLQISHEPIIFTDRLFKRGFQTLVNEITAFLVNDGQVGDDINSEQVVFELHLHEDRLWIFIHMGLSEPRKIHLKRFNTGGANGSAPHDFIEGLLNNHADGGVVSIELIDKSESIPKLLERIGMKGALKNLFFGPSKGSSVTFYGYKVSIPRNERCRTLLDKLEKIHQRCGSPEFWY